MRLAKMVVFEFSYFLIFTFLASGVSDCRLLRGVINLESFEILSFNKNLSKKRTYNVVFTL